MVESKRKILVIDDEPDILNFIRYNLEKEGFDVATSEDGEAGLEIANKMWPDLILLDVMMPKMDGIETCEKLRKNELLEDTLVVFFTARGEYYSQMEGFKAGGDAYLTKPIQPKLLIANIKALLKRKKKEKKLYELNKIGRISIDKSKRKVFVDDNLISLTKLEFNLLTLLTSRPGVVFTRDQIFNSLWGIESEIGDRTIDVHIRKLREKIGDKCLETLRGVGYRFNETF